MWVQLQEKVLFCVCVCDMCLLVSVCECINTDAELHRNTRTIFWNACDDQMAQIRADRSSSAPLEPHSCRCLSGEKKRDQDFISLFLSCSLSMSFFFPSVILSVEMKSSRLNEGVRPAAFFKTPNSPHIPTSYPWSTPSYFPKHTQLVNLSANDPSSYQYTLTDLKTTYHFTPVYLPTNSSTNCRPQPLIELLQRPETTQHGYFSMSPLIVPPFLHPTNHLSNNSPILTNPTTLTITS